MVYTAQVTATVKGLVTAATAEKSFKEPERVKLC
jgi:hypothetical protein